MLPSHHMPRTHRHQNRLSGRTPSVWKQIRCAHCCKSTGWKIFPGLPYFVFSAQHVTLRITPGSSMFTG